MSESKEVAVRSRSLQKLGYGELQPIATEDGHEIAVDMYGNFVAKVGQVEVSEKTLEKAKERVHRTHLSMRSREKKKRVAVPCYVYDSENGYHGLGWFRGIHAGHGAVQWQAADGTEGGGEKGYSKTTVILRRDDPRVQEIEEALCRLDVLDAERKDLRKKTDKTLDGIRSGMVRGERSAAHYGGGSLRLGVANDFDEAARLTDAILRNVFGHAPETNDEGSKR